MTLLTTSNLFAIVAVTLFGQCTPSVIRISRPKSVQMPPVLDPVLIDYQFHSPDVTIPSYADMQAELNAEPRFNLDKSIERRTNYTDQELALMQMQPPKRDVMKNYYALPPPQKPALIGKSSQNKKYRDLSNKKPFGAKMKAQPKKSTLSTVAPRIMDGFYERSDKTMVFADESNNVFIAARPIPGAGLVSRARSGELRKEDLNTGEYLPETDFFVIDAKDLGPDKKGPPGSEKRLPRPDATDEDEINGRRRNDDQIANFE